MSSATNAVGMLSYLTQSTAAINVSSTTDVSAKVQKSFENVLMQVTDTSKLSNSSDQKAPQKDISTTKKDTGNSNFETVKTDETVKVNDLNSPKESQVEIKETKSMEADTKLQEAIKEDGKLLVEEIAETLDVSEDEILDAMQVLGLMAVDLLNPDNLKQLVVEVSGQETALDLITDSELYTSLQDLLEDVDGMKSQLMNEYDLSDEDLETAIETVSKDFSKELDGKEIVNPEVVTDSAKEVTVKDDKVQVKVDNETLARTEVEESHTEEQIVVKAQNPEEHTNKHNSKSDTSGSGNEGANLFNQMVENIADAAVETVDSARFTYTDRAQMEDIIRQITDRITVTHTQMETSMELQLHPASLGNINILLTSSKDGIVAKFTAGNEIVKEAVESQMAQLVQKFNEQGIKVTSVEVTIASHAFEQNLQQDDRNAGQNENSSKQGKGLRRINLSEIEELDESEIDEEDKLIKEVMEMNGNSVDYSA